MTYLSHIKTVLQESDHAYLQLQNFEKKFRELGYGEGHMLFACHAAFPVLLTPDLLYKLWLNFQQYPTQEGTAYIDRVAVSDLLHAPLVKEVGTEVYEMNPKVRSALLYCLEQRFDQQRIKALAAFMLQYLSKYHWTSDPLLDRTREMQEFNALAYLQPAVAANKLRNAFSKAIQTQGRGEQFRIQSLVNRLEHQYEHLQPDLKKGEKEAFDTLVAYTKGMQNFTKGDYAKAVTTFTDTLPRTARAGTGQNIATIHVPQLVQEALEQRDVPTTQHRIVAVIVAVNNYRIGNQLKYCISDAEAVTDWLRSEFGDQFEFVQLFDEEATKKRVRETLIRQLESLESNDQLLFYVVGTGLQILPGDGLEGKAGFVCYDGRQEPPSKGQKGPSARYSGILTDREFQRLLRDHNKNDAYVTAIFDACNMGSPSWVDLQNPKQVVMAASRLTESTYESKEIGGGVFTQSLIKVRTEPPAPFRTYHGLWFAIEARVKKLESYQQHTQLFGHAIALKREFLSSEDDLDFKARIAELWYLYIDRVVSNTDKLIEEYRDEFKSKHQIQTDEELLKALQNDFLFHNKEEIEFLIVQTPDFNGELADLSDILIDLVKVVDIHELQNLR